LGPVPSKGEQRHWSVSSVVVEDQFSATIRRLNEDPAQSGFLPFARYRDAFEHA
jgi:hypothetical protein